MERTFIKIGTKVLTRHGEAKVTGIELCKNGVLLLYYRLQ